MPTPAQIASRIRAARAYADLKQPELAARMGYSTRTWVRVERGDKPLDDLDELMKVAEFCQVPISFLRDGFTAAPDREDELAGRLNRLEDLLVTHMAFTRERALSITTERQTALQDITTLLSENQELLGDLAPLRSELRDLAKTLLERELDAEVGRRARQSSDSTASGTGGQGG